MMKTRLLGILIAVVIFLTGIFCGFFCHRLCIMRCADKNISVRMEHRMDMMSRRLNLDDKQHQELLVILDKNKQTMKEFTEKMRPEMDKLRDSMKSDIRAILNETQKAEFDKIEKRQEKLFMKHMGMFGAPPDEMKCPPPCPCPQEGFKADRGEHRENLTGGPTGWSKHDRHGKHMGKK